MGGYRRTRKQNKKQYGGKYIDSGAYGCGFSPEIRCEGQTVRNPDVFSKLMFTDEATKEYAIKDILEKIDPTQQYLLYPQTMCKVDMAQLDPVEDDVDKCEVFVKHSTRQNLLRVIQAEGSLIKYKNGGVSLNDVVLKPEEFLPFFRDLVQLLEGLALMHDNDFHHLDIKAGNIVQRKINKRAYSFHYIDFGISLLGNAVISQNSPYKSNYYAWPFETRFIHPSFNPRNITNGALNEYYGRIALYQSERYPTEIFLNLDGTSVGTIQYYDKLYHDVLNKRQFILRKTDIYSLGRLFSELYSTQFGHRMHYGTIYAAKPGPFSTSTWTSISKLGLTLPAETMQWHIDLARELSIPFFTLVKDMIVVNPYDRINAKNAITRYKDLLPMFEKYCTPLQISKHLSYYTPHLATLEPLTPPPTPSNSTQMPVNVTNLFASPNKPVKMPRSYMRLVPSQLLKRGKGSRNLLGAAKNATASRRSKRR